MKKSTKALMAGLLIVPAALAMTACGGGEPSIIDTNGDYSAANASSFSVAEEMLENEAVVSDFDSYRMLLSIDMNMTETMPGVGTMRGGMKISTDSLVNLTDGFDMKSVLTMEYTGDLASMQQAMGQPTRQTTEQYIANGQGYMYDEQWGEFIEMEVDSVMQPEFDFSGLFAGTTELEQGGINVWIDNNTETGSTKIKMTMAGVLEAFAGEVSDGINPDASVTWDQAEVYYILQDGKLEGMKLSLSYSVSVSEGGATGSGDCKISMQVAKDGRTVEFPEGIEA